MKGPNGHSYLEPSEVAIAGYEGGDYRLKVGTKDGQKIIAAVKPDHMEALSEMIDDKIQEHSGKGTEPAGSSGGDE